MIYTALKYVNDQGGIQATRKDGSHVYLVPESDTHKMAISGVFGDIEEYVEPVVIVAPDQVKAEAARRIVAICPVWKQRNLTAQAVRLSEKGRANWTAEELASWDAGEALWGAIAAIRAASDVIEAMDPIPDNFADDEFWT